MPTQKLFYLKLTGQFTRAADFAMRKAVLARLMNTTESNAETILYGEGQIIARGLTHDALYWNGRVLDGAGIAWESGEDARAVAPAAEYSAERAQQLFNDLNRGTYADWGARASVAARDTARAETTRAKINVYAPSPTKFTHAGIWAAGIALVFILQSAFIGKHIFAYASFKILGIIVFCIGAYALYYYGRKSENAGIARLGVWLCVPATVALLLYLPCDRYFSTEAWQTRTMKIVSKDKVRRHSRRGSHTAYYTHFVDASNASWKLNGWNYGEQGDSVVFKMRRGLFGDYVYDTYRNIGASNNGW